MTERDSQSGETPSEPESRPGAFRRSGSMLGPLAMLVAFVVAVCSIVLVVKSTPSGHSGVGGVIAADIHDSKAGVPGRSSAVIPL